MAAIFRPYIVKAPAKVILSGEHSVVYGKPCLVTAVDLFASCEVFPSQSNRINLNLEDLKQKASSTLCYLRELKERLLDNYNACLNGRLSIRKVLQKPTELFQFALITLIDTFQMELEKGFFLNIKSDIPIGCGMGSSAATLISFIKAIAGFFGIDAKGDWLLKLCTEVEKLQHGHSSGVDAHISINGGLCRFQQGAAVSLPVDQKPLFLVNTGKPKSTTGQAVMAVKNAFENSSIWQDFEQVTLLLEKALTKQDYELFDKQIAENHRLLVKLGVVPEKVSSFITEVERLGKSAKICGAGAVCGNTAGIVLVSGASNIDALCKRYDFTPLKVAPQSTGAHVIHS